MGTPIRCLTCDTVIESMHRHDFRWCACYPDNGDYAIAVDGGQSYLRMVAGNKAQWVEETEGGEDE